MAQQPTPSIKTTSPFAQPQPATLDDWISAADVTLKTVFARPPAARPNLGEAYAPTHDPQLDETQRKLSGALMRVNHVGEVCAQALYAAQSLNTSNPALKQHLKKAAQEEIDHLDWCRSRLDALGTHASVLNPLWFTGAFVEQMETDEIEYAQAAQRAGGIQLPGPIQWAIRAAAKVMHPARHILHSTWSETVSCRSNPTVTESKAGTVSNGMLHGCKPSATPLSGG